MDIAKFQKEEPVVRFESFTGINNWYNPWELEPSALVSCTDYNITDNGNLIARDGRTLRLAGSFSDLHTTPSGVIGVKGSMLCSIDLVGNTYKYIASGFGQQKISYVNINDLTVLSDGINIGYVRNNVYGTFLRPTIPLKSAIPAGQLIEYYKGRLFIASGKVVAQSDPIAIRFAIDDNIVSGGNTRQFSNEVTLMKAVGDGIWFGDDTGIYWCGGDEIGGFKRVKKSNSKPIIHLAIKINPQHLSEPREGICFDVMTHDAMYRLGEGGRIENLTVKKYYIPATSKGCMAYIEKDKINRTITILEV